tara:strand:- start:56 stop:781 length:726 start_codon:yes stop_codon:yes gene_type:complete
MKKLILTKKRLLICYSNSLGVKIINLLKKKYDLKIYTSDKPVTKKHIFIKNKEEFEFKIKKETDKFDFIILIYWPFILNKRYFDKFKNSINFHPSYLPYLRGWYPHVHAKIKDLIWGVTLHQINYGIDTGNIWVQKKININLMDDNAQIHKNGQNELFKLFKLNYQKIINGKIKPIKQKKVLKFLKKEDLNQYNNIDLGKKLTFREFIKLFLARSYKNKSFINLKYNKKNYNLRLLVKDSK